MNITNFYTANAQDRKELEKILEQFQPEKEVISLDDKLIVQPLQHLTTGSTISNINSLTNGKYRTYIDSEKEDVFSALPRMSYKNYLREVTDALIKRSYNPQNITRYLTKVSPTTTIASVLILNTLENKTYIIQEVFNNNKLTNTIIYDLAEVEQTYNALMKG